jgi:hypothetical protein
VVHDRKVEVNGVGEVDVDLVPRAFDDQDQQQQADFFSTMSGGGNPLVGNKPASAP